MEFVLPHLNDISFDIFQSHPTTRDELWELLNHPKVYPFLRNGNPWSEESFDSLMDFYQRCSHNPEKEMQANSLALCWLIRKDSVTIGRIGIQNVSQTPQMEIFIAIHPDYQNKGYAKSVLPIMENWYSHHIQKPKILAHIQLHNTASTHLFLNSHYQRVMEQNQQKVVKLWGLEYGVFAKHLAHGNNVLEENNKGIFYER